MSEQNEHMNFNGKVFKLLYQTNCKQQINVGEKVAWSPVGPGVFTSITDAGYPKVNDIAVTCLISESGLVYSNVREQIEKNARLQDKEVNFSYLENGTYHSEGTGRWPDVKFGGYPVVCDARDFHLEWKITYTDKPDVLTESQKKQALRKQRSLEIADEQLQPLFKNFLVDIEKDKLAQQVKTLLASWIETAAEFDSNSNFYHGIVIQIGEMFGEAAKTSDDGSVQQDVLALKVPELVKNIIDLSLNQKT